MDVDIEGVTPPVRLPVRVLAWGRTEQGAQYAVQRAGSGPARAGWDFADVKPLHGCPCPIDTQDPDRDALAADCGDGWAYEVHHAAQTGAAL